MIEFSDNKYRPVTMFRSKIVSLIGFAAILSFSSFAGENSASLGESLVTASGDPAKSGAIDDKKYVLYYYSASWCGPCKAFTPKLVDFYKKNGGGENFEIVFVSADQNKRSMHKYMVDAEMPWLAIDYNAIDNFEVAAAGGPYIPSLMMYDEEGNLVAGAFNPETEEYTGPQNVLETLSEKI